MVSFKDIISSPIAIFLIVSLIVLITGVIRVIGTVVLYMRRRNKRTQNSRNLDVSDLRVREEPNVNPVSTLSTSRCFPTIPNQVYSRTTQVSVPVQSQVMIIDCPSSNSSESSPPSYHESWNIQSSDASPHAPSAPTLDLQSNYTLNSDPPPPYPGPATNVWVYL